MLLLFLDLKQKRIPDAASRGDLDEEPPLHGITQHGTYCRHSGAGYNPHSIDRAYCNGSGLSDLEHGPIVQSRRISLAATSLGHWLPYCMWIKFFGPIRDHVRHSILRQGGLSILGTGTRQRVNGRGTWGSWYAARHLASSDTPPRRGFVLSSSSKAHSRYRRRTRISFLSVIGSAGISCMTIATQGRMLTEAVHNNEIDGKQREKRGDGKLLA